MDVADVTMVKFVKMIQAEYGKANGGGRACVVVAIDETLIIAKTLEKMEHIVAYTTEGLCNLKHTDFKCIFSTLTRTMIEEAVTPSGRKITFVPLPLLTVTESNIALAIKPSPVKDKVSKSKYSHNLSVVIDRLMRFAKGHPRSLSVIATNIQEATSSDINTIFSKCATDVLEMFKPLSDSILPLVIDALRGFNVSSSKTYSSETLVKLREQGLLFHPFREGQEQESLIVPPFHLLKFADQVIDGSLLAEMHGLMPICRILKCLFELPSTPYTALEHRCLLMTMLTILLTSHNQRISVLDLFVRDKTNVYTSDKFNYMPVVSALSSKGYSDLPFELNFSTTDYTIGKKFENITQEEFDEQFPTGKVTGALMQAGQAAVDSIIFGCQNSEEPYAIFFENKFSHASTKDPSIKSFELQGKYSHFQERIVPKLIGMLIALHCLFSIYLPNPSRTHQGKDQANKHILCLRALAGIRVTQFARKWLPN